VTTQPRPAAGAPETPADKPQSARALVRRTRAELNDFVLAGIAALPVAPVIVDDANDDEFAVPHTLLDDVE
jgi:hypothetical protein